MALYQTSVLKQHISLQDKDLVNKAYKKYTKYFLNPTIQDNIRSSKEEEYQGIFLTELFANILGYTLKPNADFNLVAEYKNQNNARKADGAILNNDVAIGVIELKGTNTKDLESIRKQAFDYKANQKGCIYVITSNFEKLRFYINDATEFEEFNLFELSLERFELLYLCLQKDNILNNVPLNIKEASVVIEEQITKQFYKDYSVFKRELYRDLVKRNAKPLKAKASNVTSSAVERSQEEQLELQRLEKNVKLTLFKKSQKLIDRYLFIFFAEDRGLLPANSTQQILDKWKDDVDFGDDRPLYTLFKQYFNFLDQGRAGTAKRAEIYAYNGGLFKEDKTLDSLEIDSELLFKHTSKLAAYDFESQVDVNILGHIFENSLNEIESVNAEIEGGDFDKQKSKRKKDGVFYTPKYITKYIVENTIGKLCNEKKTELGFKEEEYFKGRKNRQKATITKLVNILDTYRDWLLQLTICDPACGSGAFLNQALDFLIKEHTYIDELKTKVLGGGLQFPDIENTILENNIYGVDLNEESVEIAKLSLWLRTAQPRRKLNDLSSNIKCGNSLIDSKAVAGDKAFNWQEQFPKVFEEKNKKAYHITTAIHDSRTSDRMVKYKVRERRDMGTNPYPNVIYFTPEDDLIITNTIANIVKEDQLNLLAYNICADHIHLLLVCHIDDIPAIMQKIKGRTSFVKGSKAQNKTFNKRLSKGLNKGLNKGLKPLAEAEKEKPNKPLWQQKYSAPKEITTTEQLYNTIKYIQNNRAKHELPEHNKDTQQLIDAMCCTQDKAFNTEFSGGFDVVIGNPPYVRKQGLMEHYPEMCDYYEKKFQSATANYDIYALFMEKCYYLINNLGMVSFILPHKFLVADFGEGIRKFFKENTAVSNLVHFGSEIVFEEASTYTCIVDLTKTVKQKVNFKKLLPSEVFEPFIWDTMSYSNLSEKNWDLQSEQVFDVIDKLKEQPYIVGDIFNTIFQGLATSLDSVYVFEGVDKGSYVKGYNSKFDYHFEIEKSIVKPFIKGNEISKNKNLKNIHYVLFPYENGTAVSEEYIQRELPKTYSYLKHFEKEIRGRERGRMDIDEGWYLYIYPKSLTKFGKPKIMTQEISLGCNMTYDENGEFYHPTTIYSFVKNEKFKVDDKYYLGILNSKVMWFFLKNTGTELRGGYFRFKTNYLKPFPLPEISENNQELIDKVNFQLDNNKIFQAQNNKFIKYLDSQFSLQKLSKKLQNWHELEFGDFIKELNKAIKANNKLRVKEDLAEIPTLTKKDEFEWLDLFEENKQKAQALQTQINQTDKEIDQMVYELYGLTEEEIKIVENS
ncbi:Eco57I restriction-modification methylase domain-containing protein [Algibacter pacificus]|uniref:Eco57I restriction-modification methylase domain-containing protein n=1 Tax=Algibacter pacificus TaxID=2599389 RepID=UPI0011CA39ED|nr:TaqI-like C-terminal specificity domain-containing protein [Algibacter pacificus]